LQSVENNPAALLYTIKYQRTSTTLKACLTMRIYIQDLIISILISLLRVAAEGFLRLFS